MEQMRALPLEQDASLIRVLSPQRRSKKSPWLFASQGLFFYVDEPLRSCTAMVLNSPSIENPCQPINVQIECPLAEFVSHRNTLWHFNGGSPLFTATPLCVLSIKLPRVANRKVVNTLAQEIGEQKAKK